MKVLVLFANGFEEVEAVTQVDFLRRAGVEVTTASITKDRMVVGTFGIAMQTEVVLNEIDTDIFDMVVLPGGLKGMENLKACKEVSDLLIRYNEQGKWLAAICASPSILGNLGLLENKNAVCYPGHEQNLTGAMIQEDDVVVDGNIITSKGPATSLSFALKLIEVLCGEEKANEIGLKTQMYRN